MNKKANILKSFLILTGFISFNLYAGAEPDFYLVRGMLPSQGAIPSKEDEAKLSSDDQKSVDVIRLALQEVNAGWASRDWNGWDKALKFSFERGMFNLIAPDPKKEKITELIHPNKKEFLAVRGYLEKGLKMEKGDDRTHYLREVQLAYSTIMVKGIGSDLAKKSLAKLDQEPGTGLAENTAKARVAGGDTSITNTPKANFFNPIP